MVDNDGINELAEKIIKQDNPSAPVEQEEYLQALQLMNPKQARAIQLVLTGAYRVAQIADMLNVSTNTIYNWIGKPEAKRYISLFQKNEAVYLQAKLKAQATIALETMGKLLDSPIDGVKFQAAKDLLDRSGFKPEQRINKNVTVQTFEQKLNTLIHDTIDVDYEEVDGEEE